MVGLIALFGAFASIVKNYYVIPEQQRQSNEKIAELTKRIEKLEHDKVKHHEEFLILKTMMDGALKAIDQASG